MVELTDLDIQIPPAKVRGDENSRLKRINSKSLVRGEHVRMCKPGESCDHHTWYVIAYRVYGL